MYLTSLTHRERLYSIATRWFADQLEPGDGRQLTEIFIYEALVGGPRLREFLVAVLGAVHGETPRFTAIDCKDALREAIIAGCRRPTPRAEQLFRRYREYPEEFFPRTPVDLYVAHDAAGRLLGMSRIKRIRRIAEKASRRVADRLAGAIRRRARALADARARQAGVRTDQLISSPELMQAEFAEAERIVSRAFRDRLITITPRDLQIEDVIGVKIVGTREQLAAVPARIAEQPGARIVEREEHSGAYNATNLIVELDLPAPAMTIDGGRDLDWSFAAHRGLPAEVLAAGFAPYAESGARTVRAEVVLTTYAELIESEFGRSIHEMRVLDQRASAPYSGRIARNASYIIEYMLMLAISPRIAINALPVRMWGHYLPDTLSMAVWQLFSTGSRSLLCDSIAPVPDRLMVGIGER